MAVTFIAAALLLPLHNHPAPRAQRQDAAHCLFDSYLAPARTLAPLYPAALEGTITSSSSTSLPLSSSAAVGAFKVSHDSKPKVVAGAIAGRLRENKPTIVDGE